MRGSEKLNGAGQGATDSCPFCWERIFCLLLNACEYGLPTPCFCATVHGMDDSLLTEQPARQTGSPAVIFDLDGTLLDTLEDLADSCNEALVHCGFPPRTIDEVRQCVGNGLGVLMERAVPQGRQNPRYDEAVQEMRSCYARNLHNKTKPYRGIPELLEALGKQGIRTGIVSNKPDAQVKELAGLYFSGTISRQAAAGEREQEGVRRKPFPDSVLAVMDVLGADKARTIYVGDSDVDIATAHNAALPCISVCWGFRSRTFLQQHGARQLADTPEELLAAVTAALAAPGVPHPSI